MPLASVQRELVLVIRWYREFFHFALLLRTTYYKLFHGLLTLAFARGFLPPSVSGRFAPSQWYSPRRLGYSVPRRGSHVSGVRASTASTVYTINTNLLSLFQFVSPKRNTFPVTLVGSSPRVQYRGFVTLSKCIEYPRRACTSAVSRACYF